MLISVSLDATRNDAQCEAPFRFGNKIPHVDQMGSESSNCSVFWNTFNLTVPLFLLLMFCFVKGRGCEDHHTMAEGKLRCKSKSKTILLKTISACSFQDTERKQSPSANFAGKNKIVCPCSRNPPTPKFNCCWLVQRCCEAEEKNKYKEACQIQCHCMLFCCLDHAPSLGTWNKTAICNLYVTM